MDANAHILPPSVRSWPWKHLANAIATVLFLLFLFLCGTTRKFRSQTFRGLRDALFPCHGSTEVFDNTAAYKQHSMQHSMQHIPAMQAVQQQMMMDEVLRGMNITRDIQLASQTNASDIVCKHCAQYHLNIDVAVTLARINTVAYCTPDRVRAWNCTRCVQDIADFQVYDVVYDQVWDLFALAGYNPTLGGKVVAFRGTDSHNLGNWLSDLRFWRVDYDLPFPDADGSMIHYGFFRAYDQSALRANVSSAVERLIRDHPDGPLYIVGHSLGAAFAMLCALDARFKFDYTDVHLYTFGAPRMGNKVFTDFLHSHVAASWRFVHNLDIVPSLPLQIMGFHHIAREVWEVPRLGTHATRHFSNPNDMSHRKLTEMATSEEQPLTTPEQSILIQNQPQNVDAMPAYGESMSSTSIDLNSKLVICNDSGEDLKCHDGACWFGICISMADHLSYFGLHMYHNALEC